QRDDRVFIISQGASKFLYYVGAFWLFFLPAARITKGGMSGMLATMYTPEGTGLYYTSVALIALCGVLSFFLLLGYSRAAVWLVGKINYRYISFATMFLLVALVYFFTGIGGLAVMLVATPIGWLPVLWGSRRMNCLGVLLVPITLNLAGWGPTVAGWLGLI
ncbi:MAG: tripartite tricarboxylate transporter permease, partial [Anaerolineales bacterium]|nr:tripartite tricarboxylate transporter permease [Anaerolineales bacterium]